MEDWEILRGSKSLGWYYYGNGRFKDGNKWQRQKSGEVSIEITESEYNQLKTEMKFRNIGLLNDDTIDESMLKSGNQSDTFKRNFNKLQKKANNSHLKKGWVDNDTNRQVIGTYKRIKLESYKRDNNGSGHQNTPIYELTKYVSVDWSLTSDEKQEYNKERDKIIEFRNSLSDEEYAQKFTSTQRGQINKIINTNADNITEREFNAGVFKIAKYRVQREKARMAKLLENNDNTSENNVCNCK